MTIKDKILGTLYGQAIGDAMGMPSELWPVQQIRRQFNGRITTFLDGPAMISPLILLRVNTRMIPIRR